MPNSAKRARDKQMKKKHVNRKIKNRLKNNRRFFVLNLK